LSAYVLLAGPPVLLWTLLTGRAALLYAAGAAGMRLGLALAGVRLQVSGLEHLQASPAVYASNHGSNIDPPAVFLALRALFPDVRILYKAELRRLPVLVRLFDAAGFIPVERGNPSQSRPAVDRAARAIAAGQSFIIFPEGTRSRTGELLPFKKGGFIMALRAQVPIVPVAVSGGREAMRKGSVLIRPATVRVRLSEPIPTAGLTVADRDALAERVRDAIAATLAGR
jgi:1-acyl-sn-glycerol-3-phosphate acyltransferase